MVGGGGGGSGSGEVGVVGTDVVGSGPVSVPVENVPVLVVEVSGSSR